MSKWTDLVKSKQDVLDKAVREFAALVDGDVLEFNIKVAERRQANATISVESAAKPEGVSCHFDPVTGKIKCDPV